MGERDSCKLSRTHKAGVDVVTIRHGTIAQADEMADGMERGGGIRDEKTAGQSGMPMAEHFAGPALPNPETMAGLAGQTANGGLALSTTETNGEPVAFGG